jgi:four helix bundle protein
MNLEDMDVYKLGHELTLQIYRLTADFPDSERFGLVSQMRRASVSICSNLMEGYHRAGRNEFKHFISIARGSCGELSYQLMLSKDLGYIDEGTLSEQRESCERLSRMLRKLYASIN